MFKTLFGLFLSVFMVVSVAIGSPVKPLPADQAFVLTSSLNQQNQLLLEWKMAPSYYLYRNQMHIALAPDSRVKIGSIHLPMGEARSDALHGDYQAYTGLLQVMVPLLNTKEKILKLNVSYQGCSLEGFCYPPIHKNLVMDITKSTVSTFSNKSSPIQKSATHFFWMVMSFLGMGLLLAFTPCVLPMIPILSGIIVGRKQANTTARTFMLSLSYVLGMAVAYAMAGVIVALLGVSLQTFLQKPIVLITFSLLFVSLSFSLFGFYNLQLPNKWMQRISDLSRRQKSGTLVGDFFMGSLSSLIVSPCVTPPLVGVLTYIANTGDVVLGAVSLLALGIGMGIPLLLVGASLGKWLPKTGAWMQTLEKMFGVFMLLMAIWIVSRILPGPVTLLLYGIVIVCATSFLGVFSDAHKGWLRVLKGIERVLFVYGVVLLMGAISGNSDPIHPLENWSRSSTKAEIPFTVLNSMSQLNQELLYAKKIQKPVLLDFYADWCQACVLQDRYVLSRPDVRIALSRYKLLRIDITTNNAFDKKVMERFHVIAPPSILFFDAQGQELVEQRIDGETTAKELLEHAQASVN